MGSCPGDIKPLILMDHDGPHFEPLGASPVDLAWPLTTATVVHTHYTLTSSLLHCDYENSGVTRIHPTDMEMSRNLSNIFSLHDFAVLEFFINI